ncbi:hypothetical protein EMCRGX_G011178 [Ephydatia muelleri]
MLVDVICIYMTLRAPCRKAITILDNTPAATVLFSLSAQDNDTGSAGVATFSLGDGNIGGFFSITPSGELTVAITPLYPTSYRLIVLAVDGGTPPLVGRAYVNVTVIATNPFNHSNDNTCPLTYAAGVIWKAARQNKTVLIPCNNADPKFSKVTQMSRRCLPSGEWDVVDFTNCTLLSEVKKPFLIVWSSLLDEVALQQQGFLKNFTEMNFTYGIVYISSSTGLFSESGISLFAILISVYFSDEQLSNVISAASDYRGKHQACSPPFLGDSQLCTIDSDLDGIPDNPLNCTDFSYCMRDNCPYIFNPPVEGIQSDVCNTSLKGNAYRFCTGIGNWEPTNVTECESYSVRYLAQQIFLDVVNNLLDETNVVGWQILQEIDPEASSLLLKSSETYGFYVASAINTTKNVTLSRSFIVLQASKVETKSNQGDLMFPDGTGTLFENASFLADGASLVIPGAFLLERARNFTLSIAHSYWSSEGMIKSTTNGSVVQCSSTHLTSFAVLLAVKTFPESKALVVISYVGCGISMVSLLIKINFFLGFRKQLFDKPHNFVHLNLAIALFLAFLVFVAGVESAKHNEDRKGELLALLARNTVFMWDWFPLTVTAVVLWWTSIPFCKVGHSSSATGLH